MYNMFCKSEAPEGCILLQRRTYDFIKHDGEVKTHPGVLQYAKEPADGTSCGGDLYPASPQLKMKKAVMTWQGWEKGN